MSHQHQESFFVIHLGVLAIYLYDIFLEGCQRSYDAFYDDIEDLNSLLIGKPPSNIFR